MIRSATLALLLVGAPLAAAPPEKDAAEKATDAREKVICKRFTETGSLVKARRICKTKADWQRDREEARQSVSGGGACGVEGGNC